VTRYLVAGAGGMLGHDLRHALAGRDVTFTTRAELDVTDAQAALDAIADHDVVINATAYTKVDDAESHEDEAYRVNALGAENLAAGAAAAGARFVQVSTDYVFDGVATTPYAEDTALAPVSAYGRTKAAGERLAAAANPRTLIVRTAWLYGANGGNFPRTMLNAAASRDILTVVDDQRGQPTYTKDLAQRIVELLDSGATSGVFHGTNSGETTWFGLAREAFQLSGLDPERIQPTTSAAFVRPAPRPAYSVLGHDAWATIGLAPMRDWREALSEAVSAGAFE